MKDNTFHIEIQNLCMRIIPHILNVEDNEIYSSLSYNEAIMYI